MGTSEGPEWHQIGLKWALGLASKGPIFPKPVSWLGLFSFSYNQPALVNAVKDDL